jgi:death on curing protein
MKCNYPTIEQAIDLHEAAIKIFGGRMPINDFTMLHSALERPKVTFGGKDLYPDIFTKGAALIQSMILNHPFDDGNKRTALLITALFFHLNGYELSVEKFSQATYEFVVNIDLKRCDFEKTVIWLKKHCGK